VPAIGLAWQPARPTLDGGMAAAIGDQQTRRRILTVFTDLRRLTGPLGITDRSTIWLFPTGRAGRVHWHGFCDAATAAALTAALTELPERAEATAHATGTGTGQFKMAFHPPFRLSLADDCLTFGTTTRRGVCLLLGEPVPGIELLGLIRHPGLTLTVAQPQPLAATWRDYAGRPASGNADTA
jgi:hypothetical protein